MVKQVTNTKACKAWQSRSGKTTTTIEVTRKGVVLDTYMQPAQGYYTHDTKLLAVGEASVLGTLITLTTLEGKARPVALEVMGWLAQQDCNAQDTIGSLFGNTLFD